MCRARTAGERWSECRPERGTAVAAVGLVLAVGHLRSAIRLRAFPRLLAVEAIVPLVLALVVAGIGGLLREGRLGPAAFVDRVLGWTAVGTVALVVAVGWLFADAAVRGQSMPGAERTILNAATLGAVVGLVVGIYDARSRSQRRRAEQLTRLNDTLRIATQEMVDATERDELETVVCERLTDSGSYDGAWIGRYVPGDGFVRFAVAGAAESVSATLTPRLGAPPAVRAGVVSVVERVATPLTVGRQWRVS